MSEKLVRLWDKDFNLIASGKSVADLIGDLRVTVDADGDRWSGRVESVSLSLDDEYLSKILAWPVEGQQ